MQGEKQRIGDYEVLGVLGAGGMGCVYKVRHLISDRVEALKVLLPDLAGRQELAQRFLREIKLVASLNHPNIASLYSAMTIDNQLVMVMEFVEGETIADVLDRGPLPVPAAVDYLTQALAALNYAHGKGIVHRDIKPANMMLTREGVVKLMDFGIARSGTERELTRTGTTLGSIDYMSPEQIKGLPVDLRTDLYSLGISLYEMVTGQRPFQGGSDFDLMTAHIKEMPRRPIEIQNGLPSTLDAIIMHSLGKLPAERFQSAEEFRQALMKVDPTQPQGGYQHRRTKFEEPPFAGSQRGGTVVEQQSFNGGGFNAGGQNNLQVPPPDPKAGKGSNKALLYGGGAVLALCAVGIPVAMMGHHSSTTDTSKPTQTTPAPAATPAVTSPAPVTARRPAAVPGAAKSPAAIAASQPAHRGSLGPGAGSAFAPPATTAPQGKSAPLTTVPPADAPPALSADAKAKLDELEPRVDQLQARASSVNTSLQTMKASMQRDGMNLRGDISSKQTSMNINLGKTKQAFAQHDPDRTERFAGLTEADLTALEAFLGR